MYSLNSIKKVFLIEINSKNNSNILINLVINKMSYTKQNQEELYFAIVKIIKKEDHYVYEK